MTNKRMAAIVTSVSSTMVMVRCDDGSVCSLMGVAKPRQVLRVGDKGFIEYRASGALAAWFWVE